MIQSPYDPEAQFAQKRTQEWVGYKTHLTETCDADAPHLIVNVETTAATAPDSALTATIHAHLAQRDFPPGASAGCRLCGCRQSDHGPAGPRRDARGSSWDTSWQAQTQQGFDVACFRIDWEAQAATCPQGQRSRVWSPSHDAYGNEVIDVRFARADCADCPVRQQCTQAAPGPAISDCACGCSMRLCNWPGSAKPRPRSRRPTPSTQALKQIALATEPYGLRRTRYIGLAKTDLQNIFIALAINLARVTAWWAGKPRPDRVTKFSALRPHFKPPNVLLSRSRAT